MRRAKQFRRSLSSIHKKRSTGRQAVLSRSHKHLPGYGLQTTGHLLVSGRWWISCGLKSWRLRWHFRYKRRDHLPSEAARPKSFNPKTLTFNTLRTGDADLRFYVTTAQDGWRRFAFLTRWNSVHLQVLFSATLQGGMFPEVSHPQALLGSLVSISWKFQFTKVVSEFVINF